tara:strand:+ start:1140 stop:1952 length:813 start_codon:yes stop_codon:yes gene_type:complete
MAELVKIADMTTGQIASLCDHTFLKTAEDFAEQAKEENITANDLRDKAYTNFLENTCNMDDVPYGICVYPEDVGFGKSYLSQNNRKQMKISAVAGFPKGYKYSTKQKIEQAKMALDTGADEIDMVLNYRGLNAGHFSPVYADIARVTKAVHEQNGLIKVIFENSALGPNGSDEGLIVEACHLCTDAGADFVKTSTGFEKYGAKAKDLETMRANFGGGVKMAGKVKPENVYELLGAVSGRTDGLIDPDPRIVRIGESSLISGLLTGLSGDY